MKSILPYLLLSLTILSVLPSCAQRKSGEVTTTAEQITTTDSNAVVPSQDSIDSLSLDPKTHESALQQDPPPSSATSSGTCNLSFITLSNPSKQHHIFQVKGFESANFKCWTELENHAIKLCGDNMPCEISYVDVADITKTTTPPYHVDAISLKNHGIGHFSYKNQWWELKGSKLWNRTGKGYEYYNSNRY